MFARKFGSNVAIGGTITGSPVDGDALFVGAGGVLAQAAISGIVKWSGSGPAAAVAGTDYLTPAGNGSQLTGLTFSQVTGTVPVNQGGTGQITASAAFNALSPLTTLGDVLYGGASGAGTRLAGNTTATRKFLRQLGNGTVSAAPVWDTPTQADVGLSAVENTALSTWAGSTNLVTLGTITTGTWTGSVIGTAYGGAGNANGVLKANGSGTVSAATAGTDYVAPGGVSGGQTIDGGTGASENLTLVSTANAAKGKIILATSTTYVDSAGNLTQTSGQLVIPTGSNTAPGLCFNTIPGLGFYENTATDIGVTAMSGSIYVKMGAHGLSVDASSPIGWSTTAGNAGSGVDTLLSRSAAGVIGGPGMILVSPADATKTLVIRTHSATQSAPLVGLQAISSTSTARDVGYLNAGFSTSTDATYKGYVALAAQDFNFGTNPGGREGIRVGTDGTQALVGAFGATPIAKPTVTGSRGANAALASLLTALANLGWITDSSS